MKLCRSTQAAWHRSQQRSKPSAIQALQWKRGLSGTTNIKYCYILYQYEGSGATYFCLVLRKSPTLNSNWVSLGSIISTTSVGVSGDTDMEDIPITELLIRCSVLYTFYFSSDAFTVITINFKPLCNAHFGHVEALASAQVHVPAMEKSPMDTPSKYPSCIMLHLPSLISTHLTLCV